MGIKVKSARTGEIVEIKSLDFVRKALRDKILSPSDLIQTPGSNSWTALGKLDLKNGEVVSPLEKPVFSAQFLLILLLFLPLTAVGVWEFVIKWEENFGLEDEYKPNERYVRATDNRQRQIQPEPTQSVGLKPMPDSPRGRNAQERNLSGTLSGNPSRPVGTSEENIVNNLKDIASWIVGRRVVYVETIGLEQQQWKKVEIEVLSAKATSVRRLDPQTSNSRNLVDGGADPTHRGYIRYYFKLRRSDLFATSEEAKNASVGEWREDWDDDLFYYNSTEGWKHFVPTSDLNGCVDWPFGDVKTVTTGDPYDFCIVLEQE